MSGYSFVKQTIALEKKENDFFEILISGGETFKKPGFAIRISREELLKMAQSLSDKKHLDRINNADMLAIESQITGKTCTIVIK